MADLRFSNISKRYWIREGTRRGGVLGRLRGVPRREFWAVRDVSFDIERGEAVGIIGHNGAGKSTVLKLLSSITTPTEGEIMINGRLSALLEVGSGFHPELTGRENVYLSGAILGMRRGEITAKLDDIIDFAEIRKFIDVPVKRYSSGMYVRLGFAIAAHLDPDILLLDEVLAVGDTAFQDKCIERVLQLKASGKTIVFISHDLSAVERLCSRVMVMKQGQVIGEGKPAEMIAMYRESAAFVPRNVRVRDVVRGGAEITQVQLLGADGRQTSRFRTGYPMKVRLGYEAKTAVRDVFFAVYIAHAAGDLVCSFTTRPEGEVMQLDPGSGVIEFDCAELGLQPGFYHASVTIEQLGYDAMDWHDRCATFSVDPGKSAFGAFRLPYEWRMLDARSAAAEEASSVRGR